jgi:hypothetical protein
MHEVQVKVLTLLLNFCILLVTQSFLFLVISLIFSWYQPSKTNCPRCLGSSPIWNAQFFKCQLLWNAITKKQLSWWEFMCFFNLLLVLQSFNYFCRLVSIIYILWALCQPKCFDLFGVRSNVSFYLVFRSNM